MGGNQSAACDMVGSADINKEMEEIIAGNNVEEAKRKVNGLSERWKVVPLNIGIVGERGVGKSSLINNISRKQLAEIGVTETTTEAKEYRHPDNKQLAFWDMPGFGTSNYPDIKSYLACIRTYIERFDVILYLYKYCFKQTDAALYKELQKITQNNKPLFIVRTRFDNDIQGGREEETVKQAIQLELTRNGLDTNCYFIANCKQVPGGTELTHHCHDYDYNLLMEDITANINQPKRETLMRTLRKPNKQILGTKKRQLEKRILVIATIAGGIGAVPMPGIDFLSIGLILKQTTYMANVLGISDVVNEQSEFERVRQYSSYKTKVGVVSIIKTLTVASVVMMADDLIKLTGATSTVSAGISFAITKQTLTKILNNFVEVALNKMENEDKQGDFSDINSGHLIW